MDSIGKCEILFKPVGAALLCLLLAGCSRIPDPGSQAPGGVGGSLALEGVNRLREAFNSGSCASIYDAAAEPFRELEPRLDWLFRCQQLRAGLGSWSSFQAESVAGRTGYQVQVDGSAEFARGTCKLSTSWVLQNGRASLFSLHLVGGGQRVDLPDLEWPRRPRKLIDPPMRPRTSPNVPG